MPSGDASPPLSKRLMRSVWTRLPRRAWTYKLAKVLTRSILSPEGHSFEQEIELGNRFTMRIDLSEVVGNDLFCMDTHYEAPTLALWCELARDAQTIVDLGSHIGLYACAAAAANPHATILAVEAFAPNVAMLRLNARRYPNIIPVPVAIGTKTGSATFRTDAMAGGAYLDGGANAGSDTFVLDTLSLVDLCERQSLTAIDLVKIDLEGLEQSLLADQEEFWERWAPRHVLVEIAADRTTDGGAPDVFTTMRRRGYACRRLERLHTVTAFRRVLLANWYFWKV